MALSFPSIFGISTDLFLLVFMRMSGLFLFNPILGRQNMPMQLRAALGFLCALVVTPTLTGVSVEIGGVLQLMVMGLGEIFIGISLGVLTSIVIYIVQLAGELIDAQMGLTLAQTYDARTGVNMPLFGSFFNVIMMLCFFVGGAHLAFVSFVADSFRLVAPGAVVPNQQSMQFIFSLGRDYFELGLRMAIPVVAVEVLAEIAIGMMMRAVPAINIFSIGMLLTCLIGLMIILVTSTAIVTACGQLVTYLIEKAAQLVRLLPAGS